MWRARAQRSQRLLGLVAASLLLLTACASLEQEKHVAPLFTEVSSAGRGTVIDALGGAILTRRDETGRTFMSAKRPLWFEDIPTEEIRLVRFLVPFGNAVETPSHETWRLLPIYHYSRRVQDGKEQRTLIALPGVYWSEREGRILRAWFPFGGVLEVFLSFDRIEFVLWPIWIQSERHGRETNSILWPVFSWTKNAGGPSWRVWPLYGRNYRAGMWDRRFYLWPFFQVQRNNLDGGPDQIEKKWMVWPLLGRTRRGSYRGTTVLWPFFGYSRDPETGFWGWDGPWPLVRFQRGGKGDYERSRVWPFYGHYRGDGIDVHSYVWPFFGTRHEEYRNLEKDFEYLIPFWQYRRTLRRSDDHTTEYRKLWPIFWLAHDGPDGDGPNRDMGFPALNPLWHTPAIDRAYAWIWELFTESKTPTTRRQRSWLGLWRRELDEYEDRASLAGLWARRKYRREGERVRETSLFFGLLRWRTGASDSIQLLSPAMPGPGWPLERSPETWDRTVMPAGREP
jgi:hypothetical protein